MRESKSVVWEGGKRVVSVSCACRACHVRESKRVVCVRVSGLCA